MRQNPIFKLKLSFEMLLQLKRKTYNQQEKRLQLSGDLVWALQQTEQNYGKRDVPEFWKAQILKKNNHRY